eukprot:CAMPEP_0115863364 /NCGR_PEP_ID=MMETSP0287-20121206/18652_1 /TAXON_ID=412157 /ORGANISM="Chrysochromulina rotalis, Strain UIO044" /LENGTH=327 /DNA_ID=CAMNT_0003317811 /DNA_START=11 /DNA_END=994 /DNA_ORIENTATION=+
MKVDVSAAIKLAQSEATQVRLAVERAQQRRADDRQNEESLLADVPELSDGKSGSSMPSSSLPHNQSVPSLLGHLRYPFDQQITWYPEVRSYSRRELLADAIVHGLGLALGAAAFVATVFGALKQWLAVWRHTDLSGGFPLTIAAAIFVYGISLLTMLICSAAFNVGQKLWRVDVQRLALLDHIGICTLIAGSATPVLVFSCAWRSSAVLWGLMLATIFAKAAGGVLDNIALHVLSFVLGPFFMYNASIEMVRATLEEWQLNLIWVAGVFYVGGLLPWGIRSLEFHVAIWHVCVILGSACVFAVVYPMVDTIDKVAALEDRVRMCFAA